MSEIARVETLAGRLARLGFVDVDRAVAHLLAHPPDGAGDLLADLLEPMGATADPDLALDGLVRLLDAAPDSADLQRALRADDGLRARLLAVLGASVALADHLVRHTDHWQVLRDPQAAAPTEQQVRADLLLAVGANPYDEQPRAAAPDEAMAALRVAYRRALLTIAARDLTGADDLEQTAAALADLAGATLDAALAVARAELPDDATPCRLAIIGMGKCGGRELNYVSDVDVIFVAASVHDGESTEAAALATATRLASAVVRICSAATPEGSIWTVDTALRPEGKAGPLVRTLDSHVSYYHRWAQTWEFQALLKARPVAGDAELGRAYGEALAPMVWQAAARENFVEDVQAMRARVLEHVPADLADRQLKLGPGGLRDVEFAVQLLQLVHGRVDESLREQATLPALRALAAGGYVGRDDAAELGEAYTFLRSLEHRLQMHRLRRTHVVPDGEQELRRLGRSLGMSQDPVAGLLERWQARARTVRRLHEKLFFRPLLAAVARLTPDEVTLSPQAAEARLRALGYADPGGALRHIEALTSGLSRRTAIQRTLLPAMLGWFADAPDPDGGLLAFRRVSEALGSTPWYLRLLRDSGEAARRLARLLGTSRLVADLLLRAPDGVAMLADDAELVPRSRAEVETEMLAAVGRHDDPVSAAEAVRGVRRRELFRVGVADLLGQRDVEQVGAALSAIAGATLQAALTAAERTIRAERRGDLPVRLALIAMGHLGGHEMGYGSDADVLVVIEPTDPSREAEATEAGQAVVTELRRMLGLPGPEPPMDLDVDLRPEGRAGPLVRTAASYAAYYSRWGQPWERQALLRAGPVAGDAAVAAALMAVVDPWRWPTGGVPAADVREIRRIKARVESERLPRGVDPSVHVKLGPGGLADVEWAVQLLQLRHAATVPALATTSTLAALAGAVEADLLTSSDATTLAEAWRLAARIRNAATLVRGRPTDIIPTDLRERRAVGAALGYSPPTSERLIEDYRRSARRARTVVERVFYS